MFRAAAPFAAKKEPAPKPPLRRKTLPHQALNRRPTVRPALELPRPIPRPGCERARTPRATGRPGISNLMKAFPNPVRLNL
jgi:hypothetical protein